MKTPIFYKFIWMLVLPAFLLINGCEKSQEATSEPQTKAEEAYGFPDIASIVAPVLVEATMDNEFSISDDGIADIPDGDLEAMSIETLLAHHPPFRCSRRALLDSLNLSVTQVGLMRKALATQYRCITGIYVKIRQHNQMVIDRGNLARRSLLQDLKDGTITRAEFQRKLNALNKSIREALINGKDRKRVINALKDCHKDFLRHLNRILTTRQWQIWVAWHRAC